MAISAKSVHLFKYCINKIIEQLRLFSKTAMIEVSYSCTAPRLWNAIKMLMRKPNATIYLLGLEVLIFA